MKHKKLKLSVILLLGLGLAGLQAQEAIPTTGGNASGSGGSAGYSVGQVVYTTNTGTNGSVAQGVQQPYEISTTDIEAEKGITLQCSAYPNPSADYIKLNIENFNTRNFTYQLYDINGKLLETKKIVSNETNIVMSNLVSATYFLRVTEGDKKVKTFNIIKN